VNNLDLYYIWVNTKMQNISFLNNNISKYFITIFIAFHSIDKIKIHNKKKIIIENSNFYSLYTFCEEKRGHILLVLLFNEDFEIFKISYCEYKQ
jgi:hypothetical protein